MPQKGQLDPNASERSKQQRKYNSTPEQKKRRAARNHTRALMIKKGAVRKGDGNDVDHKDGNPSNKSASNLQVMSASANRSKH